ncbi:hypothetical protein L6164_015359 [Bauhinia variegata]|uniref:Uncharacterized protein n=1 Tax=Bauhinia variegata TaxID=167791 RepID=A0ACB9NKA8_BAUVA|nr:hypothetical protein L6164_015359 [Bauhinia variegata]
MEMQRLLFKTALILLFLQFGLARQMPLSSRIEWLALLELRSSLGIRGKEWPIKAPPCSTWPGVYCQNGRVVGLNVSGLRRTHAASLHSRFTADSLANFTFLSSFNASGFFLNGSIPDWFGYSLAALQVLDLSSCSLTGLIPSSLGNLSRLNYLSLSGNSLTGRTPSTLGQLSRLSVLNLSRNSLTGSIPSSFSSLRNLTKLDISSNFLSGSVPDSLGDLSSLKLLSLSDNGLTASIPAQLAKLFQLVKLDLSKNSLSGPLPDSLFSNLLALETLSLAYNDFDGTLPAVLWSMPNLVFLDVSSNELTGPLPQITSNINTSLVLFNLSNNLFYGFLNTSLNKFQRIYLSSNYFQGEGQSVGLNNASLANNCLEKVPNQRSFQNCRLFYVQRNLNFSNAGGQERTLSPLPQLESRNNKQVIFILAGIFGGLGFISLLALVLILLLRKCNKSIASQRETANVGHIPEGENQRTPKDPVILTGFGESFTYEQMLCSTGNFAEANIIKRGHSGDLFRGILEGGVTVVVKKVDLNLIKRESYLVELELLSKVSHPRLVPLLGHCSENENEKFLIYEYMPNGDLATSLHRVTGPADKLQSLDWITRLKIAIGAAEALSYLHECSPPLVHRDVQASSILLEDNFEVRLGSLSEVTSQGDLPQSVITKFFRKPQSSDQGTSGLSSVTCTYDVYCFGKVLLELVTGNLDVSKSDDASTGEWLEQTLSYISIYDKELVYKIVDPSLIVDEDLLEEVWAMAIVARSCLNPKPSKRPPMRHVLKALENPLKVVREEYSSSARLRTTSSRRSWSTAFFGSWRQSSSESATAPGHTSRERDGISGLKQSGRVGSHGSGGNEHSSSNKRSSNEIFPEPLEMQGEERQEQDQR